MVLFVLVGAHGKDKTLGTTIPTIFSLYNISLFH